MKLINQALIKRFKEVGRQVKESDPIVVTKFFTPSGGATWYATEYIPEENVCYGYVCGLGTDEWGYFSIDELESIKCPPFGLPIERDLYFDECRFSQLKLW